MPDLIPFSNRRIEALNKTAKSNTKVEWGPNYCTNWFPFFSEQEWWKEKHMQGFLSLMSECWHLLTLLRVTPATESWDLDYVEAALEELLGTILLFHWGDLKSELGYWYFLLWL